MKRESVARANARLRKLVGDVHARVDAHHARPEVQHPEVQCKEGCAHAPTGCCSLITIVELAEAEYIAARNREAVERAMPRLLAACDLIEAHLSCDEVTAMFGDKAEEQRVAQRYHELGIVCPFLDDSRRCSIYRDRPLACRTHFVLSPPKECDATGVNMNHVTLDKGTRIQGQAFLIHHVAQLRHGELMLGTLPQLVLVAVKRQRGEAIE